MANTQNTNQEAQNVDDILDSIVETVLAAREHTDSGWLPIK